MKVKAWWDLAAAQPHLLCSQQDCGFSRARLRSRRAARVGQVWAFLATWSDGMQVHIFNSASALMQRWNCWFTVAWGITASFMKNWLCSNLSWKINIFPSAFPSFLTVTHFFESHLSVMWWLRYAGYCSADFVLGGINGWLTTSSTLTKFSSISLFWDNTVHRLYKLHKVFLPSRFVH